MDNTLIVCATTIVILVTIILRKKYCSKLKIDDETRVFQQYRDKIEQYVEPADINKRPPIARLIHTIRKKAMEINKCSIFVDEAVKLWRISEEGDRPLLVLVMGEFKTGKSTFINALLGAEVLKTDAAPATAVVSILRYGEKPQVQLCHGDGNITSYDFNKLEEITAEGDKSKQVLRDSLEYVEIFYPNEMLKKINLVDTPGLNVHRDSHIKSTENFQLRADVVLWVFNATRSATRTEIAEIEALGARLKPFAIVNRIDNIDEDEEGVEEVLDSVRKRLGKFVQDVIGISARQAREAVVNGNDALLEKSGWSGFLAKLDSHFIECSDNLKLTSMKEKIKDFTTCFEHNISDHDKVNKAQEKNFSDQKTAVADVKKAIADISKAKEDAFKGRQRIAQTAKQFMIKYNKSTLEIIKDAEDLAKMSDELLNCIYYFLPFVDFLENDEKAKPIIENINLLNDEIGKEVVRFRGWFSRYTELVNEVNDIDSEHNHVKQLQQEYNCSGLFGGEPIFDFSGRRERLNNAVDDYNNHLEKLQLEAKRHWENYKCICLDVIEKNKNVSCVGEKISELIVKKKAGYEEELQRLENNFDKERAQYMKVKKELEEGQNILGELHNIVTKF